MELEAVGELKYYLEFALRQLVTRFMDLSELTAVFSLEKETPYQDLAVSLAKMVTTQPQMRTGKSVDFFFKVLQRNKLKLAKIKQLKAVTAGLTG